MKTYKVFFDKGYNLWCLVYNDGEWRVWGDSRQEVYNKAFG